MKAPVSSKSLKI